MNTDDCKACRVPYGYGQCDECKEWRKYVEKSRLESVPVSIPGPRKDDAAEASSR
jgi:predicted ATP-dependent serine protease